MINVKELSVGDWVNFQSNIVNLDMKVSAIFENGVRLHNEELELTYDSGFSNIHPIPLTSDILVKNGWRKQTMLYKDEWYGGISLFEEHGKFYYMDFKIKYVHQLQQLLRLMGIEKEIKL